MSNSKASGGKSPTQRHQDPPDGGAAFDTDLQMQKRMPEGARERVVSKTIPPGRAHEGGSDDGSIVRGDAEESRGRGSNQD